MTPENTIGRHQPAGYFGVGAHFLDHETNIGSLFRTAQFMGASYIFTVGKKYERQASDTGKAWRELPLYHYENMTDLYRALPMQCKLVAIEIQEDSIALPNYEHPEQAVYLLGNETHGLPTQILNAADAVVHIPSTHCLNVAVAGSQVIYDRVAKQFK